MDFKIRTAEELERRQAHRSAAARMLAGSAAMAGLSGDGKVRYRKPRKFKRRKRRSR